MYKELNEQELAGFCCGKDGLAEEELYRRYAARVYTLCRRYVGDDDEAKDLTQDVLIRALEKIGTFKYTGPGSLSAWIQRIAVNMALNRVKRQRWRTVSLDAEWQDTIPDPTEEEMRTIPQEKLLAWISALPPVRRAVFNLYCLDGYSHKEIGKMLGISEKGSAGMLAKARAQLKKEIQQYLKDTEP